VIPPIPRHRRRAFAVTAALVVVAGWLLRVFPALHFGAWVRTPVDYDDAVYFTAALLARDALPYRDFVLVHPPGLVWLLQPVAWLAPAIGPAAAFAMARGLMTLVGAASIALSAVLAWRAAGPVAAIAAAVVYAISPEAALHDRSTYLEPALNLACLGVATFWLSPRFAERPRSRAFLAGLLLGAAVAIKVWGALWLIGLLATAGERRRGTLPWVAAGAALVLLLALAPFLIAAPNALFEQTFLFQLSRPDDGMARGLERAVAMLRDAWPFVLLAAVGLFSAFVRRRSSGGEEVWRSARFFGAAWIVVAASFLVSSSYWPDYNAHLAPSQAHLAGLGAAALYAAWWRSDVPSRRRRRPLRATALALLVVAALGTAAFPLARSLREAQIGGDLMKRTGAHVRELPAGACYFPFEPAWALAGDRLPTTLGDGSVVVDIYATMLLAAHGRGRDELATQDALHSRAAQMRLRELIRGCEFLSLGDRGALAIAPRTRQWIERRWQRLPEADETAFDLWRLRPGGERGREVLDDATAP